MALSQNTIQTLITLVGGDAVRTALDGLATSAEAAAGKIVAAGEGTAAAGAKVAELGQASTGLFASLEQAGAGIAQAFSGAAGSFGGLIGGARDAGSALGGLGSSLEAIIPNMRTLIGLGSVAAFFELSKSAAEATHALENASATLGLTTERFEALRFAAATAGLEPEKFVLGMDKFTAVLGKAQEGFQKTVEAANAQTEAVEKNRLSQEKSALAYTEAQNAMSATTLTTAGLADGVEKARIAADHAAASYNVLRDAGSGVGTSADSARAAQVKLADAATSVKLAQDGIVTAQAHLNASYETAAISAKKVQIAHDEMTLSAQHEVPAVKGVQTAFEKLGVSLFDAAGVAKTNDAAFGEFADKIKALPTPAAQAAAMLQVFGKSWAQFMPLVLLGSAGIAAATGSFDKLGIASTEAEKVMATAFVASFEKMKTVLDAMKNAVGNIVGQVFVPLMDTISGFVASNQDVIRGIAAGFSDTIVPLIKPALAVISGLLDGVSAAIRGLIAAADLIAGAFNAAFGTHVTGPILLVVGVLLSVLGPVKLISFGLAALLALINDTFGEETAAAITKWGGAIAAIAIPLALITGPITLLGIAVAAVAVVIIVNWKGMVDFLTTAWNGFVEIYSALVKTIEDLWTGARTGFEDDSNLIVASLSLIVNAVKLVKEGFEAAYKAGQLLRQLTDAAGVTTPSAPASVGGSGGGWVRGPGTSTSDSIDARLSDGEFVHRTAAVQHYGVAFMHAINSLRLPRFPGFSLGGLVEGLTAGMTPRMAFAGGGPVAAAAGGRLAGHVAIDLTHNGTTFSMLAPKTVADKLALHARGQSIRSAGKKPGWYE